MVYQLTLNSASKRHHRASNLQLCVMHCATVPPAGDTVEMHEVVLLKLFENEISPDCHLRKHFGLKCMFIASYLYTYLYYVQYKNELNKRISLFYQLQINKGNVFVYFEVCGLDKWWKVTTFIQTLQLSTILRYSRKIISISWYYYLTHPYRLMYKSVKMSYIKSCLDINTLLTYECHSIIIQ